MSLEDGQSLRRPSSRAGLPHLNCKSPISSRPQWSESLRYTRYGSADSSGQAPEPENDGTFDSSNTSFHAWLELVPPSMRRTPKAGVPSAIAVQIPKRLRDLQPGL